MRKPISILAAAAALSAVVLVSNGALATDGRGSPTTVATVDFDHAFSSVLAPRRLNTPPNRERLRNLGWQRILATTTS